jgi:hypothetical protein
MAYTKNIQGLVVIILFLLFLSCTRYTVLEKREYQHFKKVQAIFEQADTYSRRIHTNGMGLGIGGLPNEGERNYITMLMEVQVESQLVSDNTLSKIHPELPETYRKIFIPCIESKLKGYRDQDREASTRGTKLRNDWVHWWNENNRQFKIIE